LRKEEGGIIATVAMIIILILVIAGWPRGPPWSNGPSPFYNPGESLPHLPAPGEIPGEQVDPTVMGDLNLNVTGYFQTVVPHRYPTTFSFNLDISVNNTGTTAIDDFQVVKMTVFYENATPFYTFGAVPEENSTIPADTILVLEYENDRDMITVPSSLLSVWQVFARVLVTFDTHTEVILTTPMTAIAHFIE
jgi:hypothetical protein